MRRPPSSALFFFNDTATTEIYTLSLHDALPISRAWTKRRHSSRRCSPARAAIASCATRSSSRTSGRRSTSRRRRSRTASARSEEHTSELQSPDHLVCRLLLEKKNKDKHANDRRL